MLLQASPSGRDAKGYLTSFAPPTEAEVTTALAPSPADDGLAPSPNPLVETVLNPILQRPALVKIQGPFSDTQLRSVANGIHHLQKLGLVSVVVIDRDDIPPFESSDPVAAEAQRELMLRDTERVVHFLTRGGAPARPILSTVTRIKGETAQGEGDVYVEAEGLDHVRRAVEEGEIPVLMPVALDEGCRARRIPANAVLCALAEAMANGTSSSSVLVQNEDGETSPKPESSPDGRMDITPARLLIINREGGIPSYARNGFPHLSINLASELDYITNTWQDAWRQSHPTSLSNLALADACLSHMPRNASALIVSHRSPAALISNLITNKPAHSASLPHALLTQSEGRVTRDTPTLIRQGLPVRILRNVAEIDKAKLTHLLETSFGRKLSPAYWSRLERDLDFVIVVGDYAGAAITTTEGRGVGEAICYLDKFAVLPSHQGDGTVDFLWVGLRDETYGLGLLDAANPSEGSLSGVGRGRDLIWRSRADNGVNKWYFERSNGFTLSADGRWKMFWCDAEQRLQELSQENGGVMRVVEASEAGRLARWAPVIEGIKSAWSD
jgi:amino-acid N-acetyltransferase